MDTTAQNLEFLEAQLNRYLHNHEGSDEHLYIRPAGLRMPFRRGRDNLEENMRYVEAQLEENLHSHEFNEGSEDEWVQLLADPTCDNQNSTIKYTADALDSGDFYVHRNITFGSNIDEHASAVSTDPQASAKHLHVLHNDITDFPLLATNPEVHHIQTFFDERVTCEVNMGETLRGHFWIKAIENVSFGWTIGFLGLDDEYAFEYWSHDYEGDGEITHNVWTKIDLGEFEVPTAAIAGSDIFWCQFEVNTGTEDASHKEFYLDSFSLEALRPTTEIVIKPAGFRFPYNWKTRGAIRNNARFLQEELSQYLHKHEVVA